MNDEHIPTRLALVEQKQDQLDDWLKDISERIDHVNDGVNNHLTEMHQMFDEFKEKMNTKMTGVLGALIVILAGVIASYLKR